jgi:hypothetical protein
LDFHSFAELFEVQLFHNNPNRRHGERLSDRHCQSSQRTLESFQEHDSHVPERNSGVERERDRQTERGRQTERERENKTLSLKACKKGPPGARIRSMFFGVKPPVM